MITLNLVETKYKSTWLPNNTFQTPQSQHHISSGYRPCEHDRPRQEGWSLLVNQRTRARTQKNRNQIAESELNARSWGLTNRQAVKLFKTDWSKQNSNPKDDDGGCLIETRVSRDPWTRPIGLTQGTWPKGWKMVTQHRDLLWMRLYFDDFRRFRRSFGMGQNPL
jgi:hypothetical protein